MHSPLPALHIAVAPLIPTALSKAAKTARLLLVVTLLASGATARAQSALDGFDPNANDTVRAVAVQSDGKILMGGDFATLSPNGGAAVTRNHIARLNPDGTLDAAFDPNANGNIYAIAIQADGKILVGGDFTTIGGQTRNRIARLDPTTGLADSFNPSSFGTVYAFAVQADGKILAGGNFNGANSIGGQMRNRLARLDPATGLADSFNPNANDTVYAITVQADGKILVGGSFSANVPPGGNSIGGQPRNCIARLDATTGLADSFDPNANDTVRSIAAQADGRIFVGGNFFSIGGQTRIFIARLDANGVVDPFNPSASGPVLSIAVQADGKILAGGFFDSIGGQTRHYIARLDAATGFADSFDPNASFVVRSIALQGDGKILAGGEFTALAPNGGATVTRNRIARLETDGRLDRTLNVHIGGDSVSTTVVQPDGKILIGGTFSSVLGVPRSYMARLNTDGTLDIDFNPNPDDPVYAIAVQADGKILTAGLFGNIGGQFRSRIARLDAITGLADSFNPIASSIVTSIAVQEDGKILAGGFFTSIGGQARNRIARLNATTGLADSFNPNASGLGNFVQSIAVQADGKILVGGDFSSIGGQPRNHIARLDATTGLADGFNPNANDIVTSIAVQADGRILAGGAFNGANSIGGQTRNSIARLDATTGLADSFNPNADGVVYAIAVQGDGKILAGGRFLNIGGQTRRQIARLDSAIGLADSFNPNPDPSVLSIVVQGDGKILVGGYFTNIAGQLLHSFARLTNDTAALQNLAVTRTTITWTRGGSSQQFTRVTFESSNDNVNYTPLGNGTAAGSNWILTGLGLPTGQNIYIRARGYYRSGNLNGSEGFAESVRNVFLMPRPATLGNISTRLRVETGDNVLIGGFIVTGTQPKKVILRAIGPSLNVAGVPVPGRLADTTLELVGPSGTIALNDNWRTGGQEAEIIATTVPPANDLESAIVATLPANGIAYTAIVRGAGDTAGIGLVEVYDLDQAVDSQLANISTRGFVQTGDDVMIGGLIVVESTPRRVIVRALGPSLNVGGVPVPGRLSDTTLEIANQNGVILATNDDWRSTQEAEIIATTVPPPNDLESAIVATLSPAAYTAIVRGKNGAIGVGLVEVFALAP